MKRFVNNDQMDGFRAQLEKRDTWAGKTTRQERLDYYRHHWRRSALFDHFPKWVELEVDFSDEYLRGYESK
jgi:hypothetical protein